MISLLSTPYTYSPAYGNIVVEFFSTNQITKYKFRYVVDIYADNEFITRLKITPQGDYGQCDVSGILRNYVNSKPVNMGCNDFTPINKCQWGYLEDDIMAYRVFVGEEYATTPNGDTLIYNGMDSVGAPVVSWDRTRPKFITNGIKEWFDEKSYSFEPFYLNPFLPTTLSEPWDNHRYLTNAPRIQYVRPNEYATLSALSPKWEGSFPIEGGTAYVSDPVFSAKFEFYNENNSLLFVARTYNVESNCGWRPNCSGTTASFLDDGNYDSFIAYVGTGPKNLSDNFLTIPSNAKYYRVCLEKSLDTIPDVTPTPTPTPSSSTPSPFDCDCKVYDIINESDSVCNYYFEPCPGDGPIGTTIPPQTAIRIQSCIEPYNDFGCRDLIITYVEDCNCNPEPTPTPTPTISTSSTQIITYVIAENSCTEEDDVEHFVLSSIYIPNIGDYFCYNNTVYKIVTFGGGGFINTNINSFYPDYSSAYAVCPCGTITGDTENCQDSIQISEWFYYYFDDECSPNSKRIMFENKLGTYDYYTFRALDDYGYNVNRQTYTESPELYSRGWSRDSYQGWNYTTKVWNNPQSKTGILRSGFIPKSDAIWLAEELLRSPRVYIIDDNGDLEPIILTNNEVVQPNPDRPGLMEIVVEYQGGYKEIRQNN